MCGITASVGAGDAVDALLASLENLEYRGYDSAGIAVQNGAGISVTKREGSVSALKQQLSAVTPRGTVGVGHTRWSTHGPPTDANAHPHVDCDDRVAVVHNGIIENHGELREDLEARGHEFASETDSEVVPHLIEAYLDAGEDAEAAFVAAVSRLEGSYALAAIVDGEDRVYATRDGSPLVLGVGPDANYLASDVPAFLEFTDRVVYLEDGDVVVVRRDGYRVTDRDGDAVERPVETVDWNAEDAEKAGFDHYMEKEIYDQPASLRQTLHGRSEGGSVTLEGFPSSAFDGVSSVHLVACGTSYHAGLYGERVLSDWGVPARAYLASEYAAYPPPVGSDTLVVGVTQSGETADTLEALRVARGKAARTLALTNVVGSTAAREADEALYIRAGPEIGVAATKTFSSQVVALVLLGERVVRDVSGSPTAGHRDRLAALRSLPSQVESVLETSRAGEVADRHLGEDGHFFVGRGSAYAVALEGALKFKEITYEHAEGFAAGELKHGPLALVTPDTPVFAVCTGAHEEKLVSTVREVQTRGGPVVAVAPRTSTDLAAAADAVLSVPATHPDLVAVLGNVQLQLLAYHAAVSLGRPIDKPRNLAKSVTVQ